MLQTRYVQVRGKFSLHWRLLLFENNTPRTLQFTVLLDTTTTPQHTDVSGALWEHTSLSLVKTTASPALATPVQISMAPPMSRIAKVSDTYISDTERVFGSELQLEGSICQAGLQFCIS